MRYPPKLCVTLEENGAPREATASQVKTSATACVHACAAAAAGASRDDTQRAWAEVAGCAIRQASRKPQRLPARAAVSTVHNAYLLQFTSGTMLRTREEKKEEAHEEGGQGEGEEPEALGGGLAHTAAGAGRHRRRRHRRRGLHVHRGGLWQHGKE